MQNGSALNPWAYDDPTSARRKAFQLGEILGLTTTDSEELLAFLQNISSKEIVTGLHNALTDEVTNLLRDSTEYRNDVQHICMPTYV